MPSLKEIEDRINHLDKKICKILLKHPKVKILKFSCGKRMHLLWSERSKGYLNLSKGAS